MIVCFRILGTVWLLLNICDKIINKIFAELQDISVLFILLYNNFFVQPFFYSKEIIQ